MVLNKAYSVESTVTEIKMEFNPSADLNVKSDAQHVAESPGFHPGRLRRNPGENREGTSNVRIQ